MKDRIKLKQLEDTLIEIDERIRTKMVGATKTYRLFPGDKTAYVFGYNVGADMVLEEVRRILKS